MKTNDGKIYIFSGASRTGKTAKAVQVMQALNHKTVFAWDIEAQWCELKGFTKITTIAQLWAVCKAGRAGKYALVYGGDLKAGFEKACACVFHYANFFGECLFIAEELADVTSVGKAGQYWGVMVRRGLKRGLSIIAISQRWQEADKTAIGNASEMFVFAPSTKKDAVYMADMLGTDIEKVTQLQQFQYLHWVKFKGATLQKLSFK